MLGFTKSVPLSTAAMAKSLRVTFYPTGIYSSTLNKFLERLTSVLVAAGVEVISYEQALAQGRDGRVGEGIALFAPGNSEPGNMAIDHVSSLSKNTVVGILDGAVPRVCESRIQERVNVLVSALVWHMAHIVIYVDHETWTVCNMNGAIDTFSLDNIDGGVLHSLIPKLAAPVVPPQSADFDVRPNAFDPDAPELQMNIHELLVGSDLWGKTGLLASQTRIDELAYRNHRYKRIAAAYLSWRTGMSYGFLARQLPMKIRSALSLREAHPILRRLDWDEKDFLTIDGILLVAPKINEERFLVRVPDVTVLCTRSGCEKTRLDAATDLVMLTLKGGRVTLGTARGLPAGSDCQPSFDTSTILSHAIGNAVIASLLVRINPASKFGAALGCRGLAIAHWHGFLDESVLPLGYYLHGKSNLPVSCSTPQAAIYALAGKLSAFQASLHEEREYLGDAHIEPSHGTNISGRSLSELAQLVTREY
jgi:hypothetical protein